MQEEVMNCTIKKNGRKMHEGDLQLGELEMLEELPGQSGERILRQVSAEEQRNKHKCD